MFSQSFYAVDGWVLGEAWVDVESVEVVTVGVHTKMSVVDTIYVDHGDYHKDKHVSEEMSPKVLTVEQKINYSLHGI